MFTFLKKLFRPLSNYSDKIDKLFEEAPLQSVVLPKSRKVLQGKKAHQWYKKKYHKDIQ